MADQLRADAPLPPLGLPPLPLIQDAWSLVHFLVHSLDDAAEDLIKFSFILVAYWLVRRNAKSDVAGAAALTAVGAAILFFYLYPIVDHVADAAGDIMAPVQNSVRAASGLPEKRRRVIQEDGGLLQHAPPPVPLTIRLIDDLVEDAFKAVCILSHAHIGALLQTAVVGRLGAPATSSARGARPSIVRRAAGKLLAIGQPLSQYTSCDAYADTLGDRAQRWAAAWQGEVMAQ